MGSKTRPKESLLRRIMRKNEVGTLLPLLIMCAIIGIVNKDFFAFTNLVDVLRSTSYSFIIAAPLTCLMIAGGTDLTIGAVTSLGGVVCAWFMLAGIPIWLSILLTMVVGGLFGVLKALIVVKGGLHPFIVTLGLQYALNGFILICTSGMPITGFDESFKIFGQGRAFGVVYWTIVVALVIGAAFHVILTYTKYGRTIYAVGGNEETARLAGINVRRTRFLINVYVSVFAALCGVFMASRFNSAQTAAGSGTELTIMASVIIGGTGMGGGAGSILGTFFGVLLLSVINNGLVLMHVSSYWQNFIFGTILVLSLFIDKYRRSRGGGNG